jgi:uncharacterized membrane protein YccC
VSVIQLKDKAVIAAHRDNSLRAVGRRWVDRLLGSDPGLNRLRSAGLSVVSIGLIMLVEVLFVRLTGALQITGGRSLSTAQAAAVAAANHEYLVVMMLLGAMVGMISSFVSDAKPKGQLVTMLLLPVPMVGAIALGLELGHERLLSLTLLIVITTVGTYLRRFGPRGMLTGILLFLGFFLGFFLHEAVSVHDLGWFAAAIGLGLAVAIGVRFILFSPKQAKALQRTQGSFIARAQKVTSFALEVFDDPDHDPRTAQRLESRLLRMNEAALMIDAQLGDPDAVEDGSSRQQLHQRLFDLEMAVSNVARFSVALARMDVPEVQRAEVRLALLDIVQRNPGSAKRHAEHLDELLGRYDAPRSDTDPDGRLDVLLHRFAGSIEALSDAVDDWLSLGTAADAGEDFKPAVALFGGWLPGSAGVSSLASSESGEHPLDRVRLKPWTRLALQMGVALGLATVLGDLVSPSRYYWAVIAVFVTFMGANNSGEQIRKALFRISGTVIGIVVGSLVVDAVGHHARWSIVVILASLFLGFYLMRVNYTFFVIAITVVVSQLYQELNEFSNTLLLERLAETALGAAVTIIVVALVFPLRTRRVLRVAFRSHVRAIGALVDHAGAALSTEEPPRDQEELRNDARAVDASYQALVTTAQPLRRGAFGSVDEEMSRVVRLASVSRNYSRDLVTNLASTPSFASGARDEVRLATDTLHRSMDTVADAMTGSREGVYVRSSSLYDRVERSLGDSAVGPDRRSPAIRDFKLIDGSMAALAEFIGLKVTDLDTSSDT